MEVRKLMATPPPGSFYAALVTIEEKYDLLGRKVPWYLWPFRHQWVRLK